MWNTFSQLSHMLSIFIDITYAPYFVIFMFWKILAYFYKLLKNWEEMCLYDLYGCTDICVHVWDFLNQNNKMKYQTYQSWVI